MAFAQISRLCFYLTIAHPYVGARIEKGSGSYSRKDGAFYASATLDYGPWTTMSWDSRVHSIHDALRRAAKAIHKTRISDAERECLLKLIDGVIITTHENEPSFLLEIKPIYLVYHHSDDNRPDICFKDPAHQRFGSWKFVRVDPSDALKNPKLEALTAPKSPEIFKMYKRLDGKLEYWECWPDVGCVIEHRGVCGEQGETKSFLAERLQDQTDVLTRRRAEAKASGFRKIPISRHKTLIVERNIAGFGDADDLDMRHELEAFLNEHLGWLGLGHCDGGSTGSGSMEAFCLVVDAAVARDSVAAALKQSNFAGFSVR